MNGEDTLGYLVKRQEQRVPDMVFRNRIQVKQPYFMVQDGAANFPAKPPCGFIFPLYDPSVIICAITEQVEQAPVNFLIHKNEQPIFPIVK